MKNSEGQTRRMSLLESLVSVISGYFLTVLIQFYLFPLFGINVPMLDTLFISLIIVLIAFAKNYSVRRIFNYLHRQDRLMQKFLVKEETPDASIER